MSKMLNRNRSDFNSDNKDSKSNKCNLIFFVVSGIVRQEASDHQSLREGGVLLNQKYGARTQCLKVMERVKL